MSTKTVRADQIRPGDQIDTQHVAGWGVAAVEHAPEQTTLTMNTGARLTYAPDDMVERRTWPTLARVRVPHTTADDLIRKA